MPILDIPDLRDRTLVFRDRAEAGRTLASLVARHERGEPLVLAVPAGGVPVAVALADRLGSPLDVAVVSKITPPRNSEIGYGAVAFDGTVVLNDPLLAELGLSERDVRRGIETAWEKVQRRVRALRGGRPAPDVGGRSVILVDDGLASGFTLRTAVEALREHAPARIAVAVPTASSASAEALADAVDALYVANLRHGPSFAVADAYLHWRDVSEAEVARLLADRAKEPDRPPGPALP